MEGGYKNDADKIRMELLSPEFLEGVSKVLTEGAKKYDENNWKKGMSWKRVYGALMRHTNAWYKGEDKDPETDCSHLYHAACCLMFLSVYQDKGLGQDDRDNVFYEKG